MENQHRHITGYRDLSADEIALMNEIKETGAKLEALQHRVLDHVQLQSIAARGDAHELQRLVRAEPGRWVRIGNTHFQEGLMALVRAVAQPGSY